MKTILLAMTFGLVAHAAVKETLDVPYVVNGRNEQRLDLYVPTGSKEKPKLLVFIHGGAWISGDKSEYAELGKALSAGGVAVAVVNYRLSLTSAVRHPAHVEDLFAALKFLGSNDEKYGYDGTGMYVAGHSAGAHMAAFFASDPKYPMELAKEKRVRGYVGISGIYDLPKLQARFPGYKDWFLTKAFGPEAGWADASPVRRAFGKQRWLLIHSPGDDLVDLRQTDDFASELRKHQVPVELVTPKGYDHFQTVKALFQRDSVETKAVLGFLSGKPR